MSFEGKIERKPALPHGARPALAESDSENQPALSSLQQSAIGLEDADSSDVPPWQREGGASLTL